VIPAGPRTALERFLARYRPAPVHEAAPHSLRRAGALAAIEAAACRPVSAASRGLLRLAGRSGRLDPRSVRSIAFVKVDHLGDVIMASPVIRALARWAPGARVTVYARPATADFFRRLPAVGEVGLVEAPWVRPDSGSAGNLRAALALAWRMRARRYGLAVDLRYHNRLDSLILSLCGARARLGFDAGGFGFGLTHRARWPHGLMHEADRMADALRQFGIPVRELRPEFPVEPGEIRAAAEMTGRRAYVAVHVGAGNPVKRWMPERFAWVARELATRTRLRVAVLSGPGEEALGEPVVRALPRAARLDLRGRLGLFELGAVIKGARLFLGNDGGAGHVAAAVGTPSAIVFSGTNEAAEWAPRGGHVRIVEGRVPCKPCARTTCPFNQACLRAVTVDEVLRVTLESLGRG